MIVPSRAQDVSLAAAVAGASLALYVATLQPDFGGPEDTPKFEFIGYVLGIPHPPGYPLYVLLSHAFVALPIGTIAYRANLFSALMAALACSLVYIIGRQLGACRWTSLCAALGLATGASFWRSAVFAEVYSLAAAMAALTIALTTRVGRAKEHRPAAGGGRRFRSRARQSPDDRRYGAGGCGLRARARPPAVDGSNDRRLPSSSCSWASLGPT